MYQIVRNMSHKGQFKELFIRLDFNKFYQNTAVGSAGATSMTRNIIQWVEPNKNISLCFLLCSYNYNNEFHFYSSKSLSINQIYKNITLKYKK